MPLTEDQTWTILPQRAWPSPSLTPQSKDSAEEYIKQKGGGGGGRGGGTHLAACKRVKVVM